jgi:hypothetical protein
MFYHPIIVQMLAAEHRATWNASVGISGRASIPRFGASGGAAAAAIARVVTPDGQRAKRQSPLRFARSRA